MSLTTLMFFILSFAFRVTSPSISLLAYSSDIISHYICWILVHEEIVSGLLRFNGHYMMFFRSVCGEYSFINEGLERQMMRSMISIRSSNLLGYYTAVSHSSLRTYLSQNFAASMM